MNAVRAPWSQASFLAYLGGLTILVAVLALLSIEAADHGAAGLVGWSALMFAILAGLAFLSRRNGRSVTAGLYALSANRPAVTERPFRLDRNARPARIANTSADHPTRPAAPWSAASIDRSASTATRIVRPPR